MVQPRKRLHREKTEISKVENLKRFNIGTRGQLLRPKQSVTRTVAGGRTVLGQVSRQDIITWWDPVSADLPAVGHFVDVYINMVCHFVNTQPSAPALPTAGMQPRVFYDAILKAPAAGPQLLRASGLSSVSFRSLTWFFIPIEISGHSSLVAVSPANRTVEYLDSNIRKQGVYDLIFSTIFNFLAAEYGRDFFWTEWKMSYENCPRQPLRLPGLLDSHGDCGTFTCLFAMRLVCNKRLDWNLWGTEDEQRRDNPVRRKWLVREVMNGSFTDMYGHSILTSNVNGADNRHLNSIYGWTSIESPFIRNSLSRQVQARGFSQGIHDNQPYAESVVTLNAWCAAALLPDESEQFPDRNVWAATLSVPEFIEQIEMREMDVIYGEI